MRLFVTIVALLLTIDISGAKLANLDAYREMIVDMHNAFRRRVAASDMREMEWEDGLADKAGYWSKWCTYERRSHRHGAKYGENLYPGNWGDNQKVIFDALNVWFDQGDSYSYKPFRVECGDTCEYTQLMWANTDRVGCAINKCGRLFNGYQTLKDVALLVCFYKTSGNVEGEFPYRTGVPCAGCPGGTGCRDRLCSADVYVADPMDVRHGGDPNDTPQDSGWADSPAYMYAEGRQTSYYSPRNSRRYPDDLRYRRAHEEQRRRHEEYQRQVRQREEERRRRKQYETRRAPAPTQVRRTPVDRRRTAPYNAQQRYSYVDEYNRVCSCECRRDSSVQNTAPRRSNRRPNPAPLRQSSEDLTQTEKYELISVHNLMRDEEKRPRISWNAELESWSGYIIRCDADYPGPKHTATSFGTMVSNEDMYTFVHAWGSEGGGVGLPNKHCRPKHGSVCSRHSNLMDRGLREFACSTKRCSSNRRRIVCLYR